MGTRGNIDKCPAVFKFLNGFAVSEFISFPNSPAAVGQAVWERTNTEPDLLPWGLRSQSDRLCENRYLLYCHSHPAYAG